MFDAIVLAGGSSRRLRGVHKPALVVGERTMLDTVLAATAAARTTVVVGPRQPTCRPVTFTQEQPQGGGPAAGLQAGLSLVTAGVVAVLAADLPLLDVATVSALVAAAPAVLLDADGHGQWLCGAWPTAELRAACTGDLHGARLHALLAPLEPTRLAVEGEPWRDVDTVDDLVRVGWAP